MSNPRSTFEDRLWDALKHEAGRPEDELPADRFRALPARRPATARRVGVGVAAAAVVGSALAVLPGGSGAQAAYAYDKEKDGTVRIVLHDHSASSNKEAQASLLRDMRNSGIPAAMGLDGRVLFGVHCKPASVWYIKDGKKVVLAPLVNRIIVTSDHDSSGHGVTLTPGEYVTLTPKILGGHHVRWLLAKSKPTPCTGGPFPGMATLRTARLISH